MADNYAIQWSEKDIGKPGTWISLGNTALVYCPNNGDHAMSLSKHSIDAGGEVNPSLVCPYLDCGFHEWIILKGWDGRI